MCDEVTRQERMHARLISGLKPLLTDLGGLR
jgi:hypothetical protein